MMKKSLLSLVAIISMLFILNTNVNAYNTSLNDDMVRNVITEQYLVQNTNDDNTEAKKETTDLGGKSSECAGVLSQELLDYINKFFNYIKILVPIYLVVMGTFDMGKAVVAGDEKTMRTAQSYLVKRTIAAVVVFFTPAILNIILKAAGLVEGVCGIE